VRADDDASEQLANDDGKPQAFERLAGDAGAEVDQEEVEEDAGEFVHARPRQTVESTMEPFDRLHLDSPSRGTCSIVSPAWLAS
jgi:hypothetical protein